MEKRLFPQISDAGKRLDLFLAGALAISRTMVGKIIKDGGVLVNGKAAKASYRLAGDEELLVSYEEPVPAEAIPQNIPLVILYEDEHLIVVNKPRGMVVHPAAGNSDGTLVNALLGHCKNLSGIGGVLRPGIVHRLDKDTSGVMVVAKSDVAHLGLAKQFHERTIERRYIALVHGVLAKDAGTISGPIGRHPVHRQEMAIVPNGRRAVTHWRCLERFPRTTLIEAKLETGRTHQIRVHFAHIGHPLVGDPLYGRKKEYLPIEGQALHAAVLGFIHPVTGEKLYFETPMPDVMLQVIEAARNDQEKT